MKSVSETCYELFRRSGKIGYYLLFEKTERKGKE